VLVEIVIVLLGFVGFAKSCRIALLHAVWQLFYKFVQSFFSFKAILPAVI